MDTSFIAKQPPPVGCLALFVGIDVELLITTETGRQSSRKLLRSVISACHAEALAKPGLPRRSLAKAVQPSTAVRLSSNG
jgi:hypothetical protein